MKGFVFLFPPALIPTAVRRTLCAVLALAALSLLHAADTRPVVGPGATKEEALNAYGWPTGQSQLGAKEILNYPQGSITLANGRVERVDFSTSTPWPAPRPRPGTPVEAAAKRAETKSFDPWTTSLPDAVAQAAKQHGRILAAFVGSDWSPPSKRFLDEVATHPDFVNPLIGDFVFLKLDFPTRISQPAELKKQNEDLRARCGVTTYPALVVISARGDPLAVVDLARETAGDNYRTQIIGAVSAVRELLKQRPAAAEPKPIISAAIEDKPAAATSHASSGSDREGLVQRLLASAGWALTLGLGGGAILASLMVWWVWRARVETFAAKPALEAKFQSKVRLKDIPTPGDLQALPTESLRQLVAGLFEAGGYTATLRPAGADADIELRRRGHTKANVLVCCCPASVGPIGAKHVREFFGTLVASGIEAGWIVTTTGIASEAQAVANERGIELIDAEGLIDRLRQLPSEDLGHVLSRAGA